MILELVHDHLIFLVLVLNLSLLNTFWYSGFISLTVDFIVMKSLLNIQQVRAGQGNLSLPSVQANQQYHAVQQYPEDQADQENPTGDDRERDKKNWVDQGIRQQELATTNTVCCH